MQPRGSRLYTKQHRTRNYPVDDGTANLFRFVVRLLKTRLR